MSELDKAAAEWLHTFGPQGYKYLKPDQDFEDHVRIFKAGAEWQLKQSLSEDGGNEYAMVCALKAELIEARNGIEGALTYEPTIDCLKLRDYFRRTLSPLLARMKARGL